MVPMPFYFVRPAAYARPGPVIKGHVLSVTSVDAQVYMSAVPDLAMPW